MLAGTARAQYYFDKYQCPPENIGVALFRNLTDVREALTLPYIDDVMRDAKYARAEIQEKLEDVDVPWMVMLPNITENYELFCPFVHRCCENFAHQCTFSDIVLQYVNYQDGVCWVVWPEQRYLYRKCTCCACLLQEDCPVVGRCVETDYSTVEIIVYCPHIMYSDRFVKLALRLPKNCRCAAQCPVPDEYIYNHRDGLPHEFGGKNPMPGKMKM
nr:hypothetical protein BaRGS_032536 [Batillaria attramentaria]